VPIVTTSNTALAGSELTSCALTATSSSTKKETDPARQSSVRLVSTNFGAERFDNRFATNGRPWSTRELTRLKKHASTQLDKLVKLFPGRTPEAVKTKRTRLGFTGEKNRNWTREEDGQLRDMCSRGMGWTAMARETGIDRETIRSRCLTKLLIRPNKPKVKIIGEPFADAIRQRAAEDGIAMRGLDREIGTGTYFTSNCELRAMRGSGPDMNAIAKAVEFFGGELAINWKDE